MSVKTILVHLESETQAPHLLNAAVRLADQNQAHLIGTYIAHPLDPYVSGSGQIAISGEIEKILMKREYEQAAKLEKLFDQAIKDQNFVAEWRFDKSSRGNVLTGVLEQARIADLLLVSPMSQDYDTDVTYDQIGSIITRNARPTMVVPEGYLNKSLGEFVFIAWDGSPESSRAVFDAAPMLRSASSVWLHRVKSSDEAKRHDDVVTRQMADALARHGVKLEMSESTSSARNVGAEILSRAGDRGADCIVMGAYGHSRLHGFLLGSVTRHVLEHSSVPLLMSH